MRVNGMVNVLCATTKTTEEAFCLNALPFDKWHGFAFYSTKMTSHSKRCTLLLLYHTYTIHFTCAVCFACYELQPEKFNGATAKIIILAFSWLLVSGCVRRIFIENNKHSTSAMELCAFGGIAFTKCEKSRNWWKGFVCNIKCNKSMKHLNAVWE